MKKIGIVVLVLSAIYSHFAWGTEWYVHASANGNNSGLDWQNAFQSLPDRLNRGDTYFIAGGNYSGYKFNDAEQGSAVISVRKATGEDHGTNVGWQASYANAPAVFTSLNFTNGYYVLDGQAGGGHGSWNSGYGIRVARASNDRVKLVRFDEQVSHITLAHIDLSYDYNERFDFPAGGPPVAVGQDALYSLRGASDITIQYCRFNRAGRTALLSRGTWENIVIEHNYFRDNTIGTNPQHGEIWSAAHSAGGLRNIYFRYNYVQNFTSTGGLLLAGADGVYVYGNVWHKSVGNANGIISNWSREDLSRNVYVYNNTFVEVDATIGFGNTQDWFVYNNLFYKAKRINLNAEHDFNAADQNLSELNGQLLSRDPFVNLANRDFRLARATSAGKTLDSEFSRDLINQTRAIDGSWDRGAFEYTDGAQPPPSIPELSGNSFPIAIYMLLLD